VLPPPPFSIPQRATIRPCPNPTFPNRNGAMVPEHNADTNRSCHSKRSRLGSGSLRTALGSSGLPWPGRRLSINFVGSGGREYHQTPLQNHPTPTPMNPGLISITHVDSVVQAVYLLPILRGPSLIPPRITFSLALGSLGASHVSKFTDYRTSFCMGLYLNCSILCFTLCPLNWLAIRNTT